MIFSFFFKFFFVTDPPRKVPHREQRQSASLMDNEVCKKRLMVLYRFFARMDSNPNAERAATIGRGERGDLVFVGMAVGTIVGVREDWVFAGRVVGIIV